MRLDSGNFSFQSTLPAWGETTVRTTDDYCYGFQSTLPAWGETQSDIETYVATLISIHSPRMGRDDLVVQVDLRPDDFNPLSPHGERRAGRIRLSVEKHFNPLSPHGERPFRAARAGIPSGISIHSPRMGRDQCQTLQKNDAKISIHSPAWGETPST